MKDEKCRLRRINRSDANLHETRKGPPPGTVGWFILHPSAFILLCILLCPITVLAQRGSTDVRDPVAAALRHESVYVGKTRRNSVDAAALRALAASQPAERPLKIVVVSQLPDSGRRFGTRDRYTKALHDTLGLGRGVLVVVTTRGVSVATDAVSAAELLPIVRGCAARIETDPHGGIQELTSQLDRTSEPISSTSGTGPNSPGDADASGSVPSGPEQAPDFFGPWMVLLPMVFVGAGGLWIGYRAAARNRERQAALLPVSRLRAEVLSGLTYADAYLDLLPDSAAATAAREARMQAAGLYEQASPLMHGARTIADYGRAQALLEQAAEQTNRCRTQIDAATGGTGFAVGVDGTDYRATPAAGGTGTMAAPVLGDLRAADIPPAERAACFFCSRPARISDLTPVNIVIGGKRRKVLACADDVRIVQQGATPQLRTVSVSGRPVPWYSAPGYDPYRDYAATRVYYEPPFGGYYGSDGGFVEGLLLGSLLSPAAEPMLYPVFVTPSGDVTGDFGAAASPDFGGSDAYGPDGASYDGGGVAGVDFGASASDPGVAGADFSNTSDSSSSDFGNADFGSGSDSSSDFGSSDSGGSDFGSSDS